jgi:hypothetical protein
MPVVRRHRMLRVLSVSKLVRLQVLLPALSLVQRRRRGLLLHHAVWRQAVVAKVVTRNAC